MADEIRKYHNAVDIIKTAILQSQARAVKVVNPELLKALPPKEELQRVFVESSRKENEK